MAYHALHHLIAHNLRRLPLSKKLFLLFLLPLSLIAGPIETLESITDCPSIGWIQQGERWTFENWMEDKREEILPYFAEMGYFNEKHASENYYTYGVVLGSLHASVTRRMAFLVEEWKRGVRFDTIVFLTGQRKLHPEKEPFDHLEMEVDMMKWVWEEMDVPAELRALPLIVIDAKPHPFRKRPNTMLTVKQWLQKDPKPGSCLVFSCQPYLNYQEQILKMVLPETFTVETIGPGGGSSYSMSVLLDTAARVEILKKGYLLL